MSVNMLTKQLLVGIDAITLYVPSYALDLSEMEKIRNLPKGRLFRDLGQKIMAICPTNQDIITMAVNACLQLDPEILQDVKLLLFATETSVDQSKAAGIYVHHFLNLSSDCRVLELKQACYSATGGLQLAAQFVASTGKKALVIASDVARYELGSLGEPTQGCGAIAMVVSPDPKILVLEQPTGIFCEHIMDFWRPNYLEYAVLSNQYSVKKYIDVLELTFADFSKKTGKTISDLHHFCYHVPFVEMAKRVHKRFFSACNVSDISYCLAYNQIIGNAYTASLYVSLCSLLDSNKVKENERVGMFSYGSGCVAEYFTGVIVPGFQKHLLNGVHKSLLSTRTLVDFETYLEFYPIFVPDNEGDGYTEKALALAPLTFEGFAKHRRLYKRNL